MQTFKLGFNHYGTTSSSWISWKNSTCYFPIRDPKNYLILHCESLTNWKPFEHWNDIQELEGRIGQEIT